MLGLQSHFSRQIFKFCLLGCKDYFYLGVTVILLFWAGKDFMRLSPAPLNLGWMCQAISQTWDNLTLPPLPPPHLGFCLLASLERVACLCQWPLLLLNPMLWPRLGAQCCQTIFIIWLSPCLLPAARAPNPSSQPHILSPHSGQMAWLWPH